MLTRHLSLLLLLAFLLVGCGPGQPADPPPGWEDDGAFRWWEPGVDTALAFRDLSDLGAMGLQPHPDSPAIRNIQARFLPMYRNHPEVVDSLFQRVAIPVIERDATPGPDTAERRELLRELGRLMRRHFVEPRARRGAYDSPAVPDSLRGMTGTIWMQVYLDREGIPRAIKRLDGVHPTMDAIVMRNFAERTWVPAYLDRQPIASWVHTSIRLGAPPGE